MTDGLNEEFKRGARDGRHPIRREILEIFTATTSPLAPYEVAGITKQPISLVNYRIHVLLTLKELRPIRLPEDETERFAC